MSTISASYARSRFASRVRDLARSGISWGTNNYPAGSDPNWFGGSTSGIWSLPPYKSGPINPTEVISHYDSFLRLYSRIRRVRIYITRQRSNYSEYNGPQAIYNGTAIAHLSDAYRPPIADQTARSTSWTQNTTQTVPVAGTRVTEWEVTFKETTSTARRNTRYLGTGAVTRTTTLTRNTTKSNLLQSGTLATEASFNDFVEQIRSVYWQASRGSSLVSLHRHICHASCHSNCHDSRGRR